MPTTVRHCPGCTAEREFVQPPCADGHGSECPEWMCVECGTALLVQFDPDPEPAVEVSRAA